VSTKRFTAEKIIGMLREGNLLLVKAIMWARAVAPVDITPNFSLECLAKVRPHIDQENSARFVDALLKAGLK